RGQARRLRGQARTTVDEGAEEIVITAERPLSASSDQTVRGRDFEYFPRRTASDLMRLVPGLHVTQHTGGAKAHQFFLRGFDAEHGQDLRVTLDGIPLNQLSHVHGQGYLDLHFIIPEAIERIHMLKGPYDAAEGNLATAGSVHFHTRACLPHNLEGKAVGGMYGTAGLLVSGCAREGRATTYLALEADHSDGFTRPGRFNAARLMLHRRMWQANDWRLDLLWAGYLARSQASDTLPKDLIDAGVVDRFGSLDPSNRVDADRMLAGVNLQGPAGNGRLTAIAYYDYSNTRIFSNYTFFFFDQTYGDQLEQSDRRHYGGLELSWENNSDLGGWGLLNSRLGLQWRSDVVWQTQARTAARQRVDTLNNYYFWEHNLGLYAREMLASGGRWRLLGGLRYDLQLVDLSGTQDVRQFDITTNQTVYHNDLPRTAFTQAHMVSPSLSAIYQMTPAWSLFLNFGRGLVTRPARDQAAEAHLAPVTVTGAECGSRYTSPAGSLSLAGSLWWAYKDHEYVFDSEFGGSVERGRSHRLGLELELRWAPVRWAWLATDLFATLTRLQEPHGWRSIPNTPWLLMTNVAGVQHPAGLVASVRGRLLGPRYHDLGLKSPAYYVVDLVLGWRWRRVTLLLTVENLFDTTWYDSVFAYPVRVAPDAEVNQGLQVTPGTPFSARLELTLRI
ncbi:MAG: hypothetical protein DRI34_14010, partial [Deltaproteobacteria bacterium]